MLTAPILASGQGGRCHVGQPEHCIADTYAMDHQESPDTDAESPVIGVLIVDDHTMFTDSLASLLSNENDIDVLGTAGTATKGLALTKALRPSVVLVDQGLPDRPGITLVGEIKALDPTIHVVMLTGDDSDHLLLSAIEAGCSGFITKDRAATDVVDLMRLIADGDVVISPHDLARLLPQYNRHTRVLGDDLTEREREVLELMVSKAMTSGQMAERLFLSPNTVRNYVQTILVKLGAHSKLEAVLIGVREGIVSWTP